MRVGNKIFRYRASLMTISHVRKKFNSRSEPTLCEKKGNFASFHEASSGSWRVYDINFFCCFHCEDFCSHFETPLALVHPLRFTLTINHYFVKWKLQWMLSFFVIEMRWVTMWWLAIKNRITKIYDKFI